VQEEEVTGRVLAAEAGELRGAEVAGSVAGELVNAAADVAAREVAVERRLQPPIRIS